MILLFEDNLIWSSRLVKSLAALGHRAIVVGSIPDDLDASTIAIVNLATPRFVALVPQLTSRGIHVIGHAGHKEKELHELGKQAGCQTLATNSELTYKIESLIAKAT